LFCFVLFPPPSLAFAASLPARAVFFFFLFFFLLPRSYDPVDRAAACYAVLSKCEHQPPRLFPWQPIKRKSRMPQRFYTPSEVAAHNTAADIWVSFLGRVVDLSGLIAAHSSAGPQQCGGENRQDGVVFTRGDRSQSRSSPSRWWRRRAAISHTGSTHTRAR
jgi:hypothetical protein